MKNWYSTPSEDPWQTVQWNQFRKDDGYYIRCGAVAWAIVYAYWDSFKEKNALFGDTCNAYNYSARYMEIKAPIKSAIMSIAGHIGTFNISYSGITWPWRMDDAWKYAFGTGVLIRIKFILQHLFMIWLFNNLNRIKYILINL